MVALKCGYHVLYRIYGKFGGDFNLAVWLWSPNLTYTIKLYSLALWVKIINQAIYTQYRHICQIKCLSICITFQFTKYTTYTVIFEQYSIFVSTYYGRSRKSPGVKISSTVKPLWNLFPIKLLCIRYCMWEHIMG